MPPNPNKLSVRALTVGTLSAPVDNKNSTRQNIQADTTMTHPSESCLKMLHLLMSWAKLLLSNIHMLVRWHVSAGSKKQ